MCPPYILRAEKGIEEVEKMKIEIKRCQTEGCDRAGKIRQSKIGDMYLCDVCLVAFCNGLMEGIIQASIKKDEWEAQKKAPAKLVL